MQYFSTGADVDAYGGIGPPGSTTDTGQSGTSSGTGTGSGIGPSFSAESYDVVGPPGSAKTGNPTAETSFDEVDPISGKPTDAVSLAMHTPTAILGGWSPAQVAESIGPVALGSLFGPPGTVAALGFSVQDAIEANQNPTAFSLSDVLSPSTLAGKAVGILGIQPAVEDFDPDTAFSSVIDAESP